MQEHACPSPGNNTVPAWFDQQLRLGYYSAVTHTDKLFGEVLDLLEDGCASLLEHVRQQVDR